MAGRRLGPDERALWARVIATVNPARPATSVSAEMDLIATAPRPIVERLAPTPKPSATVSPKPKDPAIGATLDGSWDRKLGKGVVQPDMTVDLHGHTLNSAHRLLDSSLDRAIVNGARVLLLITGKPPRSVESGGSPKRGAIRAAVGDWLAYSRHATAIAAVRNAHPRHGGTGALYIILKRLKAPR